MQIEQAGLNRFLDHEVFPKSGRMLFRCDVAGKMCAVRYHVFGRDGEASGAQYLGSDANPSFGDLIALAMTSDRLSLKQAGAARLLRCRPSWSPLCAPAVTSQLIMFANANRSATAAASAKKQIGSATKTYASS